MRVFLGAMHGLMLLFAGCKGQAEPTDYHSCVLVNVREARSQTAVDAIKLACLGKFPQRFDWDAIAKGAKLKTWTEVLATKEFLELAEPERRGSRDQYWSIVLAPNIHPDFHEFARAQFMSQAPLKQRP